MWNNILFTSDKGLHRIQDGKVSCLVDGVFYGLSWDGESIFLCNPKKINKYNKDFQNIGVWNYGTDLHQCVWNDGKLYVCGTTSGQVFMIDVATEKMTGRDFDNSNKHMNSIFIKDDHLYLCLHANCSKKCVKKSVRHSFIMEMTKDFEEIRKWTEIGCGNHNVYVEDNKLYTLSSALSQIVKIDMNNGAKKEINIESIDEKDIYPRGLARNEDYFYVGGAQHAEENRGAIKSYILAYDNDLNLVDQFEIPGLHHIREVRLINQIDKAHNDKVLTL